MAHGNARRGVLLLTLSMTPLGCGGGDSPVAPAAMATPTPTPTPDPTAMYRVTFDATWTLSTHPVDFPPDPHFSPLVGGTHTAGVRFWEPGTLASDAIEAMAERGNPGPLAALVEAAMAAGTAHQLLLGEGINSPGSWSIEFEAAVDFPLVTLVTMVAPSPDWFVGVHDLDLLASGNWTDEQVVTLYVYDAGTDSGPSYESRNADTQPRELIARLDGYPLEVAGMVAPFGTYTFTRVQ